MNFINKGLVYPKVAKESMVITIDGPSGAGKGVIAAMLAKKLSWHLLDSGAVYRAFAVYAENMTDLNNTKQLVHLAKTMNLKFVFKHNRVKLVLDNIDITVRIRCEKYANLASILSTIPGVRTALLKYQRSCQKNPGLIADGRDMGTIVFPKATVKFFLTASVNARVLRRVKQLKAQNLPCNSSFIRKSIKERDLRDTTRKIAPLQPAKNAILIDTSKLTIKEVFALVYKHTCYYLALNTTKSNIKPRKPKLTSLK